MSRQLFLLALAVTIGTTTVSGQYCGYPCNSNGYCEETVAPGHCYACVVNSSAPSGYKGLCGHSSTDCGTLCHQDDDCATFGCSKCVNSLCVKPASKCGATCTSPTDCPSDQSCSACIQGTCQESKSFCGALCTGKDYVCAYNVVEQRATAARAGGDLQAVLDRSCGRCWQGQCRNPQCNDACNSDLDCGSSCPLCHGGICVDGHNNRTCGASCTPGGSQCAHPCYMCLGGIGAPHGTCTNPGTPGTCGSYCGTGKWSCSQEQGHCTYCSSSNTCTSYEKAKHQERLLRDKMRY